MGLKNKGFWYMGENKLYIAPGSAITGEKIIGEARKISDKSVINKSGRDKAQRIELKRNAYCIIDRPLRMHESKFNN